MTLVTTAPPGFDVLRAVTGFLLLSFVPGYLLVEWLKDDLRATDWLYAVGLSLAISMFVGWAANVLYLRLPIDSVPFEEPTTSLLYVAFVGILTAIAWQMDDAQSRRSLVSPLPDYDIRALLLIATVPAVAVIGALAINRTGLNEITLLAILLVGTLFVLVYYFDRSGTYHLPALGAMSLSLLLQNTVIMTYLTRGDALIEYEVGKRVLESGFWLVGGGKAGMPRIGVLHPVYSLVMDVSLLWEFKLVHPILFAIVPLVTYQIVARYFSRDIAFLSATLYAFMPRTYQILGRNTRTGSAILFAALLLLVLLDYDFDQPYRTLLSVVFFWGVITSHYGVGPLMLFVLLFAYGLNLVSSVVFGEKQLSVFRFGSAALYLVVNATWYTYLTSGTFDFVTEVIYGQFTGTVLFTSESTATRSLAFEMPSFSYQVVFYGHILIAVLASLGFGLVYSRYVEHGVAYGGRLKERVQKTVLPNLSERALTDSNYLHLAAGLYLMFPLSFGPQILSAGRTFGFVMTLLAPFPILLLRSTRFPRIGAKPVVVALCGFLLVTSGFVSAAVTHDVSPQPIIDGDRIRESGSTLEQFSYYRASTPASSHEASHFALSYLPTESTVHMTQSGKFSHQLYEGDRQPELSFSQLGEPTDRTQRYVYLSEPDTVTQTNTYGYLGFNYFAYEPLAPYTEYSTIYTTGSDRMHYNADAQPEEN